MGNGADRIPLSLWWSDWVSGWAIAFANNNFVGLVGLGCSEDSFGDGAADEDEAVANIREKLGRLLSQLFCSGRIVISGDVENDDFAGSLGIGAAGEFGGFAEDGGGLGGAVNCGQQRNGFFGGDFGGVYFAALEQAGGKEGNCPGSKGSGDEDGEGGDGEDLVAAGDAEGEGDGSDGGLDRGFGGVAGEEEEAFFWGPVAACGGEIPAEAAA